MKLFKQLTPFERGLWLTSVLLMIISYVLFGNGDILNLAASLVGATSLIFLAKGYVAGQFLMIAFSLSLSSKETSKSLYQDDSSSAYSVKMMSR